MSSKFMEEITTEEKGCKQGTGMTETSTALIFQSKLCQNVSMCRATQGHIF